MRVRRPRVEGSGDGLGAQPLGGVEAVDLADHGRLLGHDEQCAGVVVECVAVGVDTAEPFPGGGVAFHPGDDPFADHFPFELGERAQHLQHGATGGGGGVEGFGGRDERDADLGEFVDQGDEVALAAGEPVHLHHQQHVDAAGAGGGERGL